MRAAPYPIAFALLIWVLTAAVASAQQPAPPAGQGTLETAETKYDAYGAKSTAATAKTVAQWIEQLDRANSAQNRTNAANALKAIAAAGARAKKKNPDAEIPQREALRAAFTSTVRDASAGMRATGLSGLGLIADEADYPLACKVLAGDKDATVRAEAAKALGAIGAPKSLGCLESCLKNRNQPPQVKSAALKSVMQIGGDGAVGVLKRSRSSVSKSMAERIDGYLDSLSGLGQP